MSHEYIFNEIGFAQSSKASFEMLCEVIEAADGCNADIYPLPKMGEARAAHRAPSGQLKHASGVFARIRPKGKGLELICPKRFGQDVDAKATIFLAPDGVGLSSAKSALVQWALAAKKAKKPVTNLEFGDGHTLPGGLPETNHNKF